VPNLLDSDRIRLLQRFIVCESGSHNSRGQKCDLSEVFVELWPHIALDLSRGADSTNCDDIDTCVRTIADQCLLMLGTSCDQPVIMSLFAHICPHILQPSVATAVAFCMSGTMGEILGNNGSRRFRCVLVRHILQIVGEPEPLDADALLQDAL
jgi:hypothetical protein